MNFSHHQTRIFLFTGSLLLTACGQKGPLYLATKPTPAAPVTPVLAPSQSAPATAAIPSVTP